VHLLPEQRRRRILEFLQAEEAVDVVSLAVRLDVSAATIRRDLQQLEVAGSLTRTHGGAVGFGSTAFEPSYTQKEQVQWAEKMMIASRASLLIADGDVVVIDSGSTMLALARAIKRKHDLTVITTDLKVALELADVSSFDVIVTGGLVRAGLYSMVGNGSETFLSQFHANHAFMSADALSLEMGVSNATLLEVDVKRAVIAASSSVTLLVDNTKFDRKSLVRVADLSAFHRVISDGELPIEVRERYAKNGIDILIEERERTVS